MNEEQIYSTFAGAVFSFGAMAMSGLEYGNALVDEGSYSIALFFAAISVAFFSLVAYRWTRATSKNRPA